jgi:signal transduction histidine kinase
MTTSSAFIIGGIAILSQHNSQIAQLDTSLNQVVKAVHGNTNAAVSEGLYAVQQSEIALTLVYFSDPSSPTVLNFSNILKSLEPSAQEISDSFKRPVSHDGGNKYRFRGIRLAHQEFLLVGGSLQGVDKLYRTNRIHLLIYIFFFLFLAVWVTWFFIRRDIRKIENLISTASEIAGGNTDVKLEFGETNSEVDQLTRSLDEMVDSLRRMTRIEEESNQRMQDFLGDASHELRTPLTVIKGYVELLSNASFNDPELRIRAFSRVQIEILRMQDLIADLLFLAEFGVSPEVHRESVNFSELLEAHLDDFQSLNPSRNVSSEIQSMILIDGSKAHLERLISNIFGNIVRHTPADAPVKVKLMANAGQIDLIIEDGGPGLPASAYEKEAQSFERFDRSRSREDGGSGLGMSIIFAIAREHSGIVKISRSDLGGVAFKVTFAKLG